MNTALIEKYGKRVTVQNSLWGEDVVTDWRPNAGESACLSGRLFEDVTEDVLKSNSNIRNISRRPKFKCHFGLEREGDFELLYKDTVVHVECKQLGNAESHFDKLSHVFMNLICGCYGKNFWLVYDYNKDGNKSTTKKIRHLEERCKVIKEQVSLQGITFEYMTLEKLQKNA
jgi:hypothetical protein